MKVIHSYEKKNLRKLRRNEDADCTKCSFAEKTPDIEGGYVWLCHAALYDIETLSCFVPKASPDCLEAVRWSAKALKALRPVSREQVEKSWAGCEYCEKHKINLVRIEMNYNDSPGSPKRLNPTRVPKFCPICGRPLTDEAVDMVMERMDELQNEIG